MSSSVRFTITDIEDTVEHGIDELMLPGCTAIACSSWPVVTADRSPGWSNSLAPF